MDQTELRIARTGTKARLSAFSGEKELDFIDLPINSLTQQANLTKLDNFCEKHGISMAKFENKPQFLARHIEANIHKQHDSVEEVIDDIQDTDYKKIGVGLHDNKLYYGFKSVPKSKKTEPFVFVVDCEGNLYKDDDIHNVFGIITKGTFFKEVLDRTMSAEAIKTFIKGKGIQTKPTEEAEEKLTYLYENKNKLYSQIYDQIEKHIYFRDKEVYHVITSYILLTYVYVYFEAVPRLFLHAEYGSGKTKTMNLVGMLCFNPLTSGDPSASSIFRSVESTGGTLLIDDFDRVQADIKMELDRFWCVGYKRGSSVSRVNTTTYEPESFDVFGCAVMNNIEGLNPVALSRSIEVPLERAINQPQLNEILKSNDPVLSELRDRTQLTWLLFAQEFQSFIDGFEPFSSEFLQGRPQELVYPIDVIMSFFEVEDREKTIQYLSNTIKSQVSDVSIDDFFAVLIKWIWNRIKDSTTDRNIQIPLYVADISFYLVEEEFPYFSREEKPMQKKMLRKMNSKIGRQLSKFPFKKKRLPKGFQYSFSIEQVENIIKSYGYVDYCDLTSKDESKKDQPLEKDKQQGDNKSPVMHLNDSSTVGVVGSNEIKEGPVEIERIEIDEKHPNGVTKPADFVTDEVQMKKDKPLSSFLSEEKPKEEVKLCQECYAVEGFEFVYNDKVTGKPVEKPMIVCEKCLDKLKRKGLTGVKLSDLEGKE